jgi:nickel-dependent lactate racemase
VARLGGIDFSLQVVYNSKRRTCAVFAGDIVEAHHAACRMANKHYRTPTFKNADVVIANGYPLNTQATLALAWVNRSVREGGTGVLVMQHPMMMSGRNFWNESVTFRGGRSYWDVQATRPKTSTHGLIVYSQYMDKRTMDTPAFPVGTTFAKTWDQVVAQLRERHKGDAKVAVYPYGPLQHLEEPLDE